MPLDNVGMHVGLSIKVVDAATGTGTTRSRVFSIIAPPGPHKISLSQIGATVLTINPQVSVDGGVTYRNLLASAGDLIATPTISFDAWHGQVYIINIATLTTTPCDIYGTLY